MSTKAFKSDKVASIKEKIDRAQRAYNLLSDADKANVSNADILLGAVEAAEKAAAEAVVEETVAAETETTEE